MYTEQDIHLYWVNTGHAKRRNIPGLQKWLEAVYAMRAAAEQLQPPALVMVEKITHHKIFRKPFYSFDLAVYKKNGPVVEIENRGRYVEPGAEALTNNYTNLYNYFYGVKVCQVLRLPTKPQENEAVLPHTPRVCLINGVSVSDHLLTVTDLLEFSSILTTSAKMINDRFFQPGEI